MSSHIELIVVCTDDESPDALLKTVPKYRELIRSTVLYEKRPCSTPRVVNMVMNAMRKGRGNPLAWVIIHPDVELPDGFFANLREGMFQLSKIDPDYGVLGVMGVRLLDKGRMCCGHLWDRDYEAGAPLECPLVVDALDEVCVILRGDRDWRLDDAGLATYHLWASELCLREKAEGRTSYVLPGLYLKHLSTAPREVPLDPNFFFNLGVLSERYRQPGMRLTTPSGSVYDDGGNEGVQLC